MAANTFPTTEAFKRLLDQPDLWRRTGRPMRQRYALKSKLKYGRTISLKTRMKILDQAGFTVVQEAIWQLPGPTSTANTQSTTSLTCKRPT